MSQAEDLLNSLSENDISTKTEPHIVVGSNRVITVPSELKRIAVQYDHNIETVTFDCPRYWDDHDMSTMKVYINYTRADNEPGCYIADDVAVDETDTSIMHFSWTISRHVTEAVGPLTILICIKMVDKDGNEVNHWNSERNSEMTVSKGMECGDIIVNKYPDVITYLRADMGNLADLTTEDKSSLVAAINEAAASGGVQPDWNQNDSTQPDYVKNRPFYTGNPVETVLVEESTVQFTDIGGICSGSIKSTFSPTVGNAYKVYWDGTDYESACVEVGQDKCIGNLSIDGSGPDTGEPFLMYVTNQGFDVATLKYASYHTISISRFVPGVVKIDEKYLPDTVATKSEVEAAQTTAENAQTTANAARNTADAAISLGLTATTPGQIIKVKTVQDGKPTEWETVDMPSGGVEWYEVIDMETTENVNDLIISTDKNGRPISGYHALAMVLCYEVPADSTQTSDNGGIWVYPVVNDYISGGLRIITNVAGWKTITRTYNYFYAGSNRAIFVSGANAAKVFDGSYNNVFNGIRLYVHGAGDHLPTGTKVRCLVLSKGWTA